MPGKRTSILRIECYKAEAQSGASAQTAYDHNMRIDQPLNAFEELSELNRVYIDETEGRTQKEYLENTLYELRMKGAITKQIRSDAIGTMEVVFRANNVLLEDGKPPEDFDLDGWAERTLEFADNAFNPPGHEIYYTTPDGQEKTEPIQNIYSAVLHMDESNPHIHVLFTPIDDKGHLNSKYYRPQYQYSEYQQEYSEAVKEFGLERGNANSPAKAQHIRSYHRYIEEVMKTEAPEPEKDETIGEYRERCSDVIRSCHAHMADQDRSHERDMNEIRARESTFIKSTYSEHRKLNQELGLGNGIEIDHERVREIADNASSYKKLKSAIEHYPDIETADELTDQIEAMIRWEEEREAEEREERDDRRQTGTGKDLDERQFK